MQSLTSSSPRADSNPSADTAASNAPSHRDTPFAYHALRDEAGQTMAEYSVVLAVITVAVVLTLGLLSSTVAKQLNSTVGIL